MALCKCAWCGKEFDLTHVRRVFGQIYGAGVYDEDYNEDDNKLCLDCALEDWGAPMATMESYRKDMGPNWDDD